MAILAAGRQLRRLWRCRPDDGAVTGLAAGMAAAVEATRPVVAGLITLFAPESALATPVFVGALAG